MPRLRSSTASLTRCSRSLRSRKKSQKVSFTGGLCSRAGLGPALLSPVRLRMRGIATFSIVACDLRARAWGVAVASKFPAVGAVVPWAKATAGAVATQALANTTYGPRGLEIMSSGLSAEETLKKLLAHDREREQRQVGLVDKQGGSASFTGSGCMEWCGGLTAPGYAIQGNLLTGIDVVQ